MAIAMIICSSNVPIYKSLGIIFKGHALLVHPPPPPLPVMQEGHSTLACDALKASLGDTFKVMTCILAHVCVLIELLTLNRFSVQVGLPSAGLSVRHLLKAFKL